MATTKKNSKNTKRITNIDDARVRPAPGPLTVTTAQPAELMALGLPHACKGGQIIEDVVIDSREDTCRVVFRLLGITFAVGYDNNAIDNPFGSGPVELTVVVEQKKRGGKREFVPVSALAA